MTTDANAEQRAAADRKRKVAADQRDADTRWLMSHPQGRRLMWSLLTDLGLYRTPYAGEANRTNFNLGQHSVALQINADLVRCAPDEYDLMAREARTPQETPRSVDAAKRT